MTATTEKIAFEVETKRVLEILAKEIYDSPLAMLRENLQNAYDAALMRRHAEGSTYEPAIEMTVAGHKVSVSDNGIGMTEEVLRNNFWKAGSSGKRSESARKAGVVGTFGIGAMANFGVCTELVVETRALGTDVLLTSRAKRDELSIARECIELTRERSPGEAGTRITAILEPQSALNSAAAENYLRPYVGYVPMSIKLNGKVISGGRLDVGILADAGEQLVESNVKFGRCGAHIIVVALKAGTVAVHLTALSLDGHAVAGEILLRQGEGQLMGYRNGFGLAQVPVSGRYSFGGAANVSFLTPTAGREAISRDSIEQVNGFVALAESEATKALAGTPYADSNSAFMQHVLDRGQLELAGAVTIDVYPEGKSVPLGDVKGCAKGRQLYYFSGRDQAMINQFATDETALIVLSQSTPRRKLQLRYITELLKVPEIPNRATILKKYEGAQLSMAEAATIIKVMATLEDDYMVSDAVIQFVDISHGVRVIVEDKGGHPLIYLARSNPALVAVVQAYNTAYDVFPAFVKDYVRTHLYPQITHYVPSSTKEGVDALRKMLQRNRELYRLDAEDLGDLEPLLGEYLSGVKTFAQVLVQARGMARPQALRVSRDQVGQIEHVLPSVAHSPAPANPLGSVFEAAPAIDRSELQCDSKMLEAGEKHEGLNGFQLFLALSDRLFREEGPFFRVPHTTKIIWAERRIIFIFTEAAGQLSLYYDIELPAQLGLKTTGGKMLPTTTILTKGRIFIPIPEEVADAIRVVDGPREFYVRFDLVSNWRG